MPAVIPLLVPILTAAAAATTIGTQIYSLENQPGVPKPSTTPSPLTAAQNANQAASVGGQLPNLQALTGGSVSPEYSAQFGATQSGVANDPQATGNIQAAINQFFGLSAPGSSGLTTSSGPGGGGGIADLLTKAKIPGAGGEGGGNFVDSILSGDSFKGLAG